MADVQGPFTKFPGDGLHNPQRLITGHRNDGKAIFLHTDHGDHHQLMVNGGAVQNILYSTGSNPVQLTDDVDLAFARQNRPSLHMPNGAVVRMIDFSPGSESNMHRAVCCGVGTVCEGEFELSLDSGEARIMRPGDVSINRGAMHKWRNVSPDKPGRMLYFLLDVEPVIVQGKALQFDMGYLGKEYAEYADDRDADDKLPNGNHE